MLAPVQDSISHVPLRTRWCSWPRLGVAGLAASAAFALFTLSWEDSLWGLALRVYTPALMAVCVFGLLEHWPRRLPAWMARWALQVAGVALTIPLTVGAIYAAATEPGVAPFWQDSERLVSFFAISFLGSLLGPWIAMAALLRQRDARVRSAERARGESERLAHEARMRALQAQVQPHFLFNTLASVQALVDAGSPRASPLLTELVTYLRAAVPRMNQSITRLQQELEMVRAYLALMHLRMPDRLQFSITVASGCEQWQCPPMTLMTLIENAVRHGIEPSLDGGRVDVRIEHAANRCRIEVRDTGVGLRPGSPGLGTGLATLRERLSLAFAGDASLRISEVQPHGFCVVIECPAWP